MDAHPDDKTLFAIRLSMTGAIQVQCDRMAALPDILRIVADAIEAGETGLAVIDVPMSGPN